MKGCFVRAKKPKQCRLLAHEQKYQGKYVAISPGEEKIIASGQDPAAVIEKARKKGVSVPAIVFVPKKNVAYIY